jgi:hypothetical protein
MPDHEWVDHEDRWELEPRRGRRFHLAMGAVRAAVWAPIEAGLGWLAVASATAPFAELPAYGWLPEDWSAVPTATAFGVLTAAWTTVGVRIARGAIHGGRPEVVVLNHRGIRTERLSRNQSRVVVDVPWEEVRTAPVRWGWNHVAVEGTRGSTVIASAGDDDQLRAIERHVHWRLAPEPGRTRPPVVPGWAAYLDDRGATLVAVRDARPQAVAVASAGSLLCGANAVALAADPPPVPFIWWLVAFLGVGTAGLAVAAVDLARWTPRWIARPGVLTYERRLRGPVVFEARSLELEEVAAGSGFTYRLVAVEDSGGASARRRVVLHGGDSRDLIEPAGAWLARHAEIPFRSRTLHEAASTTGREPFTHR